VCFRRVVSAGNIAVLADVKKKHSSNGVTADVNIVEIVLAAQFFCADGVAIIGSGTGYAADSCELRKIKAFTDDIPVVVGSGINPEIVGDFAAADAFLVGSFKEKGDWRNEMCPQRLDQMCQAMQQLCDS